MTADQRFEQDLPALLTDMVMPSVPSYRDEIVRQIEASPQRPAWAFPERWIPMDATMRRIPVAPINWRLLALAALLVVAAVAIAIVAAGTSRRLPVPPYGPAANGLIAFERDGDIYLGDPSTGTSRVIVGGPEVDTDPLFSRDGTQLVFRRQGTGLFVAGADGSGVRLLTGATQSEVAPTDWSGDGRFIVAEVSSARPSMMLIDVETGATEVLDLEVGVSDPVFRPPDGAQIGFVGGNPGTPGIYLVNRDGDGLVQVAAGGDEAHGWFTGVSFSPDGRRIASSLPSAVEGRGSEIHIIEPDGFGDRVLPNPPGIPDQWDPRWLPDGNHLAVIRFHDLAMLAVIPIEGGKGVEVFWMADVFGSLSVSPDGQLAVFSPDDSTRPGRVYSLIDHSGRDAPPWIAGSWQRRAAETVEQPTPAPGGP